MFFIKFFLFIGTVVLLASSGVAETLAASKTLAASEGPEFLRQDREFMSHIQTTFHKASGVSGTRSLHHGHKTETVYIFLHGLFGEADDTMKNAKKKFKEGSNVLVGTLPGHENHQLKEYENSAGVWLEYAEYLGLVARRYGKKVIFVGSSTGANLAVRAAESGYADELILIQPLFEFSNYSKAGLQVGKRLSKKLRMRADVGCVVGRMLGRDGINLEDVLSAVQQANSLAKLPYRKIPALVPVDIYLAERDPVVSRKAIEKWATDFAPQAKLQHNKEKWNHFYNPLQE